MSYEKVAENVYAITDGSTRGNIAAFVLPSQIVFIDSGMYLPLIKEFREKLEEETGRKTSALVITHPHGDHIYGTKVFSDCRIISSKETSDRIRQSRKDLTPEKIEEMKKNAEDPSLFDGLEILIPTETFEHRLVIEDFDEQLIIKRTGGHTEGSSYIYYPKAKALMAGDNLFINSFPWAGDPTANPQKWIDTFKEYLSLDVDFFIPGHGPVSGKKKVQEYLDYFEKVIVLMRKLITEGYSEVKVIERANELEFYPPRQEQWKDLSLKKWYQFLTTK
ncbi:MAG: MBL fold metallo-hydrolase [Candidatus Heimdallarchaeota archaeon]